MVFRSDPDLLTEKYCSISHNLHVDVSLIRRLPSPRSTFPGASWTHLSRRCMDSPCSMLRNQDPITCSTFWFIQMWSHPVLPSSNWAPNSETLTTELSLHSVPLSLSSRPTVGSRPHCYLLIASLCPSSSPPHTIYFQNYIVKKKSHHPSPMFTDLPELPSPSRTQSS